MVRGDRTSRSPRGIVPPGNASFAVAVLLLLVIPLSLQNGTAAGLFLLATLVVGLRAQPLAAHHDAVLGRVGRDLRAAHLLRHLGGWGGEADGSAPLTTLRRALRRCWASACTS